MTAVALFRRTPAILLPAFLIHVGGELSTAHAEPITITLTGGSIEILPGSSRIGPPESGPRATISLTGLDGFQLSGSGLAPATLCDSGCLPGEQISLSSPVSRLGGTLTVQGQTYQLDFSTEPFNTGDLDLIGLQSFTLPPASSEPVEFRSAFSLDGSANVTEFVLAPDGAVIPVVHAFSFVGSGEVTGLYQLVDFGGLDVYQFQSLRFTVNEPIPEPGSLLLIASGLTGLWMRRRKKSAG
jgi:hypothetical protein